MNAGSKIRQQTGAGAGSRTSLDTVTKTAITTMGTLSAVIGLWAAASLVGAMFSAGGPLGLIRSWFQAVTGM
jgi:hypothetical protein